MIRTGVYVRSKGKPGRPMSRSERGRLGGIAVSEKRKMLNGTAETPAPLPTAFFFEGKTLIHGKCRKQLGYKGEGRTNTFEKELRFYCINCVESVAVPLSVLEKALLFA